MRHNFRLYYSAAAGCNMGTVMHIQFIAGVVPMTFWEPILPIAGIEREGETGSGAYDAGYINWTIVYPFDVFNIIKQKIYIFIPQLLIVL